MDGGQEHCGGEAGVGDAVAVAVRDALDEPVVSEPAQVVGHLSGGDVGGCQAAEFGGELTQVAVVEAVGLEPEDR